MKRLILPFLGLFALAVSAQDTTSYRMVGISTGMDFDFFYDDSTSMGFFNTTGSSGHAIFVNPADSLLYTIMGLTSGDRNLYKINPFTGTNSLAHNFTPGHINSGDIAANGNVYVINGNGSGINGQIYELNMSTMTESAWKKSVVDDARGLEFNNVDGQIYIYEGFSDSLYKINMTSKVETGFATSGMTDEIHGAYFEQDANIFFVTAYGGEMYTTNSTWNTGTLYHDMDNGVTGHDIMDVTTFPILATADSMKFCPGDSQMIKLFYTASTIRWYRDGVLIPNTTGSSIYADSAGTYRALISIVMTTTGTTTKTNFMWSEPVVVEHYTVPVVTVGTTGDSTVCPGDSLLITGSVGGTSQWYMDGILIPGATGNSYYAKSSGSYNLIKTNQSGCSDSADVAFMVYDVPVPTVSISTADSLICPGDTIVLTGVSTGSLQWYKDGVLISGATSLTYGATDTGNYNMLSSNICAIGDSALTGILISADPDCFVGVSVTNSAEFNVYPNPVSDKLFVRSDVVVNRMRILDVQGSVVYEMTNTMNRSNFEINLSEFRTGLYVLEIYNATGMTSVKLIKE